MSNDNTMSWSFFGQWNTAIAREPREMRKRDHIWASEIGGAFIDRYLKMKGEQPTNPPNLRSLRKFQAGHEWERNVRMLLAFAGIHKASEEYLTYQYPGLLKVTGRADFIAGGKPDWKQAKKLIRQYALLGDDAELGDEDFYIRVVNQLQQSLGDKDLKTIILELKSCSSYMFDVYEATRKPNRHHELQLYHYLKSSGLDEGHIVYICKDDCRMLEFGVFNNSVLLENDYRADIEKMTEHFNKDIEPEPEPEILFDETRGRFSKNWKVEYSQYLHRVYGFKTPEAYRERWDKKVGQFNRILTRVITNKNMTKANLGLIEEMQAYFPNYDEILKIAREVRKEGLNEEEE